MSLIASHLTRSASRASVRSFSSEAAAAAARVSHRHSSALSNTTHTLPRQQQQQQQQQHQEQREGEADTYATTYANTNTTTMYKATGVSSLTVCIYITVAALFVLAVHVDAKSSSQSNPTGRTAAVAAAQQEHDERMQAHQRTIDEMHESVAAQNALAAEAQRAHMEEMRKLNAATHAHAPLGGGSGDGVQASSYSSGVEGGSGSESNKAFASSTVRQEGGDFKASASRSINGVTFDYTYVNGEETLKAYGDVPTDFDEEAIMNHFRDALDIPDTGLGNHAAGGGMLFDDGSGGDEHGEGTAPATLRLSNYAAPGSAPLSSTTLSRRKQARGGVERDTNTINYGTASLSTDGGDGVAYGRESGERESEHVRVRASNVGGDGREQATHSTSATSTTTTSISGGGGGGVGTGEAGLGVGRGQYEGVYGVPDTTQSVTTSYLVEKMSEQLVGREFVDRVAAEYDSIAEKRRAEELSGNVLEAERALESIRADLSAVYTQRTVLTKRQADMGGFLREGSMLAPSLFGKLETAFPTVSEILEQEANRLTLLDYQLKRLETQLIDELRQVNEYVASLRRQEDKHA